MALTPSNNLTDAEKRAQREASQHDVFLREVDEAVRQDQLTTFGKRYGKPLGGLLFAGLLAFGGWLWWHERQESQLEATSEELVKATDQLQAQNLDAGSKLLAELDQNSSVGARAVATLTRAGIAYGKGQADEAVRLYAAVSSDAGVPKSYREFATLREVGINYDKMKPADVVDRLKPLAVPGAPYFGSAGELLGAAYLDLGRRDLAGPLFAAIAKDEKVPQSLRSRSRQLAGLMGIDAIEDVDKTSRRIEVADRRRREPMIARMNHGMDCKLAHKPKSRWLGLPTVLLLAVALSGCGVLGGKDKPKTPTIGNRQPILSRIEAGANVDPALAAVTITIPAAQVNPDWSQAGGTASKSYGHLALSESPTELWRAKIAGSGNRRRLAASPVVGDGKLFAMDTDGVVYAFDANSGARLWNHKMPVPGKIESSAFGGGASYSDGRVYATNGVGDVAALDAATGEQIWSVKPSGPLRGAPTIAFNAIYVMSQDNQIFSLNAADGTLLWQESGSVGQAGVFGMAAPAAGQGSIIAGYSSGELAAYRYENGRELWFDALSRTSISTEVGALTDVDADPIIDSGRVYALGQGGRMAAYELVTGQRIWELNLAGISTPALAGDWIFTLTDDARLLAI